MKKSLLGTLPVIGALCISANAFASGVNYHLADPGMCNNSSKTVEVSWDSTTLNGVKKTGGDLSQKMGHKLEPGKCATLSFTVSPIPTSPLHASMGFSADDAECGANFSTSKHSISDRSCLDGKNIKMTEHGNSEHFQIYITDK